MSERRDDTTKPGAHGEPEATPERERTPRSYYYDDGTGYEIYDPTDDTDAPDKQDESDGEKDEDK